MGSLLWEVIVLFLTIKPCTLHISLQSCPTKIALCLVGCKYSVIRSLLHEEIQVFLHCPFILLSNIVLQLCRDNLLMAEQDVNTIINEWLTYSVDLGQCRLCFDNIAPSRRTTTQMHSGSPATARGKSLRCCCVHFQRRN